MFVETFNLRHWRYLREDTCNLLRLCHSHKVIRWDITSPQVRRRLIMTALRSWTHSFLLLLLISATVPLPQRVQTSLSIALRRDFKTVQRMCTLNNLARIIAINRLRRHMLTCEASARTTMVRASRQRFPSVLFPLQDNLLPRQRRKARLITRRILQGVTLDLPLLVVALLALCL